MYVFGGIHELTQELNDLWSFEINTLKKENKKGFFETLENDKLGEDIKFSLVKGIKPTPRDGHSATVDS